MALGCVQKVNGERVNQREVPGGFVFGWWLKLGDRQAWIRVPRHETNIVGAKTLKVGECGVVNRRAAPQEGIDHYLQGRSCLQRIPLRGPIHGDLHRGIGRLLRRCGAAE